MSCFSLISFVGFLEFVAEEVENWEWGRWTFWDMNVDGNGKDCDCSLFRFRWSTCTEDEDDKYLEQWLPVRCLLLLISWLLSLLSLFVLGCPGMMQVEILRGICSNNRTPGWGLCIFFIIFILYGLLFLSWLPYGFFETTNSFARIWFESIEAIQIINHFDVYLLLWWEKNIFVDAKKVRLIENRDKERHTYCMYYNTVNMRGRSTPIFRGSLKPSTSNQSPYILYVYTCICLNLTISPKPTAKSSDNKTKMQIQQ